MAQSIKLGNDTYIDASGVALNNSGLAISDIQTALSSGWDSEYSGATWTVSSKSITIDRTGWYAVEGRLSYGNNVPAGVAVVVDNSTVWQVIAITEVSAYQIAGRYASPLCCGGVGYFSAGTVLKLLTKSATAGNNGSHLYAKFII